MVRLLLLLMLELLFCHFVPEFELIFDTNWIVFSALDYGFQGGIAYG